MDNQQFPQTPPPPSPTGEVRVPVTVNTPATKAIVTFTLIGFTLLIYGLQYLSQTLSAGNYDWLSILGAKVNEYIMRGEFWRLITPMFLHGSILHIGFNMYALFVIGPTLERYYGHGKFLLLYFIGGFAGNTLSFLLSPNPSLGASTAVFGLVAAQAVFVYKNRMMFGPRARGMLTNLGLIVVVNLVIGMQPGIDNWGHLGGLIGGAVFAWVAGPVLKLHTTEKGYELLDSRRKEEVWWGFLLSAGLFVAIVIGRLLAG